MAKRASKAKNPTLGPDTRMAVIHGPDQMLRKLHLDQLRNTLQAAHGEVETFTFEGKSASLADVLDELRSYSLMQTYKLVVVEEADQFVKDDNRAAMERYAANPVDHATLVFRSSRWNRGNLDKLIAKIGGIIKCEELKHEEAVRWVAKRCHSQHGGKLDPRAADILVQRVGPDLMQLDSELGKLTVMAGKDQPITPALVEQAVGQGSDDQAWAVQEAVLAAIARNQPAIAITKVRELIELAGQPDVLVMYFVADVIRKLDASVHLKRSGVSQGDIAKQMKLFGPRARPFFAVLDSLSPGQAGQWFDRIVRADANSKSGLGKAAENLEGFCAVLTDT